MTNGPDPDFSKYHVAVCTPAYDGQVTYNFAGSLFSLASNAAAHGLSLAFHLQPGISLVVAARNVLTRTALANPKVTHILWVDADIGFRWEDFRRLLLADRHLVGGVYPSKFYPLTYPHELLDTGLKVESDGFAEVRRIPAGFMLVKRAVFGQIAKAISPEQVPVYFETPVSPNKTGIIGEDWAFCDRWRSIGGRVFVDTTLRLSHYGGHLFEGASLLSLYEAAAHG